jgi:signal transduction histidine kinase
MADPEDRAGPASRRRPGAARLRRLGSVRVRITLAAVVVTGVAMAVSGWLLVRAVQNSQLAAIRDETESLVEQVAGRLASGVPPEETIRPYELTTGFVEIRSEDGSWIDLFPAGGSDEAGVAYQWHGPRRDQPASSDANAAQTSPGSDTPGERITPRGRSVVVRTVETPSGEATVTAAAPVDQVGRSLHAVRQALTIGLPLLVSLVAVAAWWMLGRALRPVDRIRAEADAISASTLHRRLPEPGTGDEVQRLSHTMNAMLERLDLAVTRQRQFVADASHELRNPVVAIRVDLEAALCEGDQADWLEVARAVLAEEARMEALIDDLLVLAAEDEGAATLPGTQVDLNELVEAEAGRSRSVPVSSALHSARVPVVGSRSQLRRALTNLVDNAERHADRRVRIGTTNRDGWAQLSVDDDGPGIPPGDRDRVLDRFTRLDDARARDHGGAGLGLAVVRAIVTRHHGSVWAEDSALGGARFVIALRPAARDRRLLPESDRPTDGDVGSDPQAPRVP